MKPVFLRNPASARLVETARGDLTSYEWSRIGPLLPPETGRRARPTHDNRAYLNGMLSVLRSGRPWREMDARYGRWNSIYVRFKRWGEQGVWDRLLEVLVDLGLTDDWRLPAGAPAGARGADLRGRLVEAAADLRERAARRDGGGRSWARPG